MEIQTTALPGVVLIKPKAFGDARGFFYESFQQERYFAAGLKLPFVQDNHSRSSQGVLRGLHYQYRHPQGKLVSVVRGEVFDVAVDIRKGSPHFGKWVGVYLNDTNHHQLYIPPGFAHGFYVVSETADFCYKCTDYYYPEFDAGILWNDPTLQIEWPLVGVPQLAQKDQQHPVLRAVSDEKLPLFKDVE